MHIPKIVFEPMSVEANIDLIKWAYFEDNGSLDVHKYTLEYFPELSEIDSNASKEEIYELIEKVVRNDYLKYQDRIKSEVERYNKIWESYNDNYFTSISNYLNIEWPKSVKVISGFVGLIPVFPRYLDTFDFSVSTNVNEYDIIRTCAHECCHFLWFEKIKELYPNIPRREYDSPYNAWQYSEMVVDPILNSNEIKSVTGVSEKAYDSFYSIKDNDGNYLMDVLKDIYNSNISIEDKIRKGYNYICSVLDN